MFWMFLKVQFTFQMHGQWFCLYLFNLFNWVIINCVFVLQEKMIWHFIARIRVDSWLAIVSDSLFVIFRTRNTLAFSFFFKKWSNIRLTHYSPVLLFYTPWCFQGVNKSNTGLQWVKILQKLLQEFKHMFHHFAGNRCYRVRVKTSQKPRNQLSNSNNFHPSKFEIRSSR